jgi:hypothetical protein
MSDDERLTRVVEPGSCSTTRLAEVGSCSTTRLAEVSSYSELHMLHDEHGYTYMEASDSSCLPLLSLTMITLAQGDGDSG